MRQLYKDYLPPALLVILLLTCWEVAVRLLSVPHYILPAPSRVINTILAKQGLLLGHTLVTLGEIGVGFLIALVVGVGLAILLFHSSILERAIYPFIIASNDKVISMHCDQNLLLHIDENHWNCNSLLITIGRE